MPNPQKLAKWLRIEHAVKEQFYEMLYTRQMFNRYKEIVEANDDINKQGTQFHNWIISNYVANIAMSIRRETDTDKDVLSLAKLITEIKDNPQNITREWHVSLWKSADNSIFAGVADRTFTEIAGTGQYFDKTIGEKDLALLNRASADITKLADRTIAHSSKQPVANRVTFNDVNKCIEHFKELIEKYSLLLTAVGNEYEPVSPQDWQDIFTKAWIKE